ncbi:MAG: ABC transporter permease subunit [Candidatus Rokubacteria bacterium]|nr:ABC transporter permease subunit [Candidatus Rokubacteria bacterium]
MSRHPDGKLHAALATEWKIQGQTTWVFKIRQGVKWHNGDPFSSADAKWSLQRTLDPKVKARVSTVFTTIDRIETPDAATLVVRAIPEMAPRIASLLKGEVDIITQLPPDHGERVNVNPSPRVVGALYAGLYCIGVNSKVPPLNNPLVKQALSLADAQLAFPFILLAIGIIAVLGPSFPTLVVVIGLSGWVSYARVLRSQVLSLRSREFVDAVHALGGSVPRIVLRHVLPNVLSSLVVIATLELARAIVLEATLSFLGLGIQPPTPSWGGMVHEGREYLDSAWWISTCPGLVLMATSIVVSRTGDWLRDLLDPTLKGE